MRSGKTGSGKTWDAVHLAHWFWRHGMDGGANTPLFFTKYRDGRGGERIDRQPEHFSLLEKMRYKTTGEVLRHGTIDYFDTIDEVFHWKDRWILFDEGQTLFRNYDWESVPRLFLQKLEQNRKHELHLITTAQRVKAVNINYRELIQDWKHFETIIDLFGFHVYRCKVKDVDFITENLQEANIPTLKLEGLFNFKLITPWSRRIYDTMYDIGFEPIQHYKIRMGNQVVKLHLEAGMSVRQAIQLINSYSKVMTL